MVSRQYMHAAANTARPEITRYYVRLVVHYRVARGAVQLGDVFIPVARFFMMLP